MPSSIEASHRKHRPHIQVGKDAKKKKHYASIQPVHW